MDPQTNSLTWGDYGPDARRRERGPRADGLRWSGTPWASNDPHNSGWPYCQRPERGLQRVRTSRPRPRRAKFFDCDGAGQLLLEQNGPDQPAPVAGGHPVLRRPGGPAAPGRAHGRASARAAARRRWAARSTTTTPTARPRGFPSTGTARRSSASSPRTTAPRSAWTGPRSRSADRGLLPQLGAHRRGMPINDNPIDLEFGPDGSLYVLEYGDEFFPGRTRTRGSTASITPRATRRRRRRSSRPRRSRPRPRQWRSRSTRRAPAADGDACSPTSGTSTVTAPST